MKLIGITKKVNEKKDAVRERNFALEKREAVREAKRLAGYTPTKEELELEAEQDAKDEEQMRVDELALDGQIQWCAQPCTYPRIPTINITPFFAGSPLISSSTSSSKSSARLQ